MGIIKQIIQWLDSGLNFDDDKRLFGAGDSDNRLNVTTNELGREFVISNMKGTVKKSHTFTHDASYLASVYTVLGSCYDDNRDAVYIFIYGSGGNDSILRFNFSDDSFDKICWDHTNLGLAVDYPIADAFMIGDFLHFNPRTSSPRSINVQWAYYDHISYNWNIVGGYWDADDYLIESNKVYRVLADNTLLHADTVLANRHLVEFIGWAYQDMSRTKAVDSGYINYRSFYNTPVIPTLSRPYAALNSDADVSMNYVRGNIFQFSYRFYVPDQGYSIAAPSTEMVINADDEDLDGEVIEALTTNNYIRVGFPTETNWFNNGHWLFEFVEFLFRKNADEAWRIAETVYHDDAVTGAHDSVDIGSGAPPFICSTYFYNNRSYPAVDSAAIEKPYNALPLLARSQWPLDGERSAYGGVTEGFKSNLGLMDVEFSNGMREVILKNVTLTTLTNTYTFTESLDQSSEWFTLYTYTSQAISALPGAGGTPWSIIVTTDNIVYEGEYAGADADDYRAAIINTVNLGPVSFSDDGSDHLVYTDDSTHEIEIKIYDSTSSPGVTKYKSFKTNTHHPYCIFYFDDVLRRSEPFIQTQYTDSGRLKGTTIFIPSLPEVGGFTGTNWQQYVRWAIAHDAPSWASSWKWGYAGNRSISQFWQYNIETLAAGTGDWTDFLAIDISGLQTITDEAAGNDNLHPNSNISSYVFEEHDRIRFLTQNSGATYDALVLAASDYDYEIKAFDESNHTIYIDKGALGGTPFTGYPGNNCMVEIYRPLKDPEDTIYYEVGQIYKVYASGGRYYHRGEIQDQSPQQTLDNAAAVDQGGAPNVVRIPCTGHGYVAGGVVVINDTTNYDGTYTIVFVNDANTFDIESAYNAENFAGTETVDGKSNGEFTSGDVYLLTRQLANGPFAATDDPVFVESYSWSDFYDSDQWGKGKFGIISSVGQKELNNIRYSNKYSPNTLSSGLATFDGLDYISLSDDHGKIIAMRQAGHVLKVYFERNSASVMVNKTQYVDADGISQIVKSDKVLGSVEYSNYHYGTIFPESVMLIDRTIYFYDIYRKSYLRDSSNGIFAVSDYKAVKKFVDVSNALLTSGVSNVQVWTAYDPERKFVYVMISDSSNSDNDDVLVFNEKRKRWETRVKMKEDIQLGALIRNEELDYRLTKDSETAISVNAITTGTDRITFTNLPALFEDSLQNPTAGKEWLCINLETYDTGGYTRTGDYAESILITGYDEDDEEYTYTVENGADTNWSAGHEVVFINPFQFFDFYNSNDSMIDKDDISIGEALSYTQAGPMFRKEDGTYVMVSISPGTVSGRSRIVPFTSTDPENTWTSTDAEIFAPTDFDGAATEAWPSGNAVYLSDEDRYLMPCSVLVGVKYSVGLYRCDEDFGNETFYHEVVTDAATQGAHYPSMVYHNGEYYIFYVSRVGASPDTSQWTLKVIKSSDYTDFSGSSAVSIFACILTADGADGIEQNKWFNARIRSTTAFVYQGRLYVMVSGESRYDVSGNRGNNIHGIFEYNASTGRADVTRTGVVFPGMLDDAWTNTTWGAEQCGPTPSWAWDAANKRFIAAITQESGSADYKIGFATFELENLFDEDEAVGTELPKAIGTTAQALISFIGEDLYIHNGNDSRGFFYNSLKKMILNIIVNNQPNLTKILDSITLNTNDGEWAVTDIDIPATAQYPRGMSSKIPNEVFTKRENGMHAGFLRNMKTSSDTDLLLELREGEELRGQTATIVMENSESGEVVLFDVLVNMSDSKL